MLRNNVPELFGISAHQAQEEEVNERLSGKRMVVEFAILRFQD
jgi:hypothetical protein